MMARSATRLVLLALAAMMALTVPARADDTALFLRTSLPPNMLIILDTSDSMTWFNAAGSTVGDEFPGAGSQTSSRVWMAKTTLNTVLTSYASQINFGLETYFQGDRSSNVRVIGPPPLSWYYTENWAQFPDGWLTYTFGTRYYADAFDRVICRYVGGTFYQYDCNDYVNGTAFSSTWKENQPDFSKGNSYSRTDTHFDLTVPMAGLGGPANASDPNGYNPATLHPNSPSFILTWQLLGAPVKQLSAGNDYVPPVTHQEQRCQEDWQYSYDQKTWTYWWTDYNDPINPPCPKSGTVDNFTSVPAQTATVTCTFSYKKTYDSPTPYVYSCNEYINGSYNNTWTEEQADFSLGNSYSYTEWSSAAYWYERVSRGIVWVTITDVAAQAANPDYYQWTYTYGATCKKNCANTGTFWQWTWSSPWYSADSHGITGTCRANLVTDPYTDPPKLGLSACGSPWVNSSGKPVWVPLATGEWTVPFDAEYKWQGNNYQLATDNSCNGGQILVDVGSGTLGTIQNFLGTGSDPTKELHAAAASTPLAGALQTALTYFTDPNGVVQTDPQKNCRLNFVLLVTDGGESCLVDLTQPGKNAQALFSLTNPVGGVMTFVVGIDQGGLMADEKTVLKDIAAKGGSGTYYSATDQASLQASLTKILGQALTLSRSYSFSPVVLPRTRVQSGMMALQPSLFLPPVDQATQKLPTFWPGTLVAYQMQGDGTLATDSQKQVNSLTYWDAGAVLNATPPTARNMKIGLADNLGGGMVSFDNTTNTPLTYKAIGCLKPDGTQNPAFPDVNASGTVDSADCAALVSLLQGDGSQGWLGKLGDIFHSQVVLVGDPSPTYVDTSIDPSTGAVLSQSAAPSTFAAFRTAKQADGTRIRPAVVGANDGFFHAFNAGTWNSTLNGFDTGTGAEVWAYSPPNFYNATSFGSTLWNLAIPLGAHTYYVDGTPKVADVWLDDNNDNVKTSSEWHTVALVNLRQGGPGVFHLDLTDRKNPKPIVNPGTTYPAFYPTCGNSWSEPAIGKVRVQMGGKKVDRWVAFFGDGDSSAVGGSPTCGKRFYVVDIKTGNSLWEVSPTNDANMKYDLIGSPTAVDLNGDGYVDRVYIGDAGGQIWRFDVSAIATNSGGDVVPGPAGGAGTKWATNWVESVLWNGPSTQQYFFERPAVALDTSGNVWVFAGTGDRMNPLAGDVADSDPPVRAGKGEQGRLYGFKDPYVAGSPAPAPLNMGNVQDVTGAQTLDPSTLTKAGWMYKLDKGEKNFTATEVFNKTVFFGTLMPGTATAACGINQYSARLYMLFYLTGGGITDVAAYKSATPTPSSPYITLGSGAPTSPVISTLSLGGGGVLVAGTSDQYVRQGTSSGGDIQFNAPTNLRNTRYWRVN